MKKLLLLLVFISTCSLASYGRCFKVTNSVVDDIWYGKFTYNDFSSSNVSMKNIKSGDYCGGLLFVSNPREKSPNNVKVFAKLNCSSGKLFEMDLNNKYSGSAIDQEKNDYKISIIKKKEYKKNIKKLGKTKNENKL